MPKRKQQSFVEGALVLVVATALAKIIGALFKIPLNNIIGDLGFGYYSSAYDLFLPIYGISMTGLPMVVSRMVAERVAEGRHLSAKRVFSAAFTAFTLGGIILTVLMLLLIKPFLALTDMTGSSLYSLLAIAPAWFFCCVISAYRGYYEGYGNMYPTAVSNIIEAACKLIFGYTLAYITVKQSGNVAYAAAAAISGVTIGVLLATLVTMLYHKLKGVSVQESELSACPETEKRRDILKMLLFLSVPVVISSFVTNVASLVDVMTVKWQLGELMEEHGALLENMYSASIEDYNSAAHKFLSGETLPTFLYGVRSKTYTIYNLVPTIAAVLGVSALPSLVRVWCSEDREKSEVKDCVNSILKFSAIIVFPAGVGMAAIAPDIMDLLYKSHASVEIGAPLLRIYGVTAIFAGLCVPLISMLQAVGKPYVPVRNMLIGAAIKTGVNILLVSVPEVNVRGAAWGTLCCFVYIFVCNFYSLCRHTGVMPDVSLTLIKPLFAALFCGATAFGVRALLGSGSLKTVVAIIAAATVYVVLLFVLSVISLEELSKNPVIGRLNLFHKKH